MMCRLIVGCAVGLVLLGPWAAGCRRGPREGKVVIVRGKVVDAGQPIQGLQAKPDPKNPYGGYLEVRFLKYDEKGKRVAGADTYSARADPTGAFELKGRFQRGIPPGKYRIGVHLWDKYPEKDRLKGKFEDVDSPIVREVTGQEEIIIDISKPEG
ncbi:MAG: hypothetical protein ACUVUC_12805 [Thermoguttaceae bacterium]